MKRKNKCQHLMCIAKTKEAKITEFFTIPAEYEWKCKYCGASLIQVYAESLAEMHNKFDKERRKKIAIIFFIIAIFLIIVFYLNF